MALKTEAAVREGNITKEVQSYRPGILKSEIAWAQSKLREMVAERGSMGKMFRRIDENKDGVVDRNEARMMFQFLNLHHAIRPPVAEALIDMMDSGTGRIEYKEFCRVMTADDPFNLGAVPPAPERKPTRSETRISRQERKRCYGSIYKPLEPAFGMAPSPRFAPRAPPATRAPPAKAK